MQGGGLWHVEVHSRPVAFGEIAMAIPSEDRSTLDAISALRSGLGSRPPPLPPHTPQVSCDAELEGLIRIAAAAGFDSARGYASAVNYETLVIGLAFGDDATSRFVQSKRGGELEPLLGRRKLSLTTDHKGSLHRAAHETELPSAEVLYCSSARQMLDVAASIRQLVAGNSSGLLGVRHLVAGYLRRNPDGHATDLRRCGLGGPWFAWSFLRFARRKWNNEHWRLLYPWPLRYLPWIS
jgi:hypothetical protein